MKRFLKDWTLPFAIATGISIYLLFAFAPPLVALGDAMEPTLMASLPVFMFGILFVTFCKVDFRRLRPVRWHWALAAFQVAMVVGMTACILLVGVRGEALVVMEALLTCLVAPTAAAAAVVTAKLGGDLEELTTYTFLSNAITALLIPLCFPLVDKAADIPFLTAFLRIFREVCIVLLVPMLLAYIVKHGLPRLHRRIIAVRDLSYYLWACSLTIITGATVRNIVHAGCGLGVLMAVGAVGLVACLVQFAVGRRLGARFGRTIEAGQGLGQKNTTFSIWVAMSYLNPVCSVGPGCYILWQNIINSIELWQKRKEDAAVGL